MGINHNGSRSLFVFFLVSLCLIFGMGLELEIFGLRKGTNDIIIDWCWRKRGSIIYASFFYYFFFTKAIGKWFCWALYIIFHFQIVNYLLTFKGKFQFPVFINLLPYILILIFEKNEGKTSPSKRSTNFFSFLSAKFFFLFKSRFYQNNV